VTRARARVLGAVRTARCPVGVDEIAGAVGLKPNAVRHHLAALEAEGLVTAEAVPTGHRGRPRRLFSPGPGRGGPYERLAIALLHLRAGDSAEMAGRAVAPGAGDVVAFLTEEGFEPRPADGGSIVLASCPLARSAALDPATVCGIHRGVLCAIAARNGRTIDLIPGPVGTCRIIRPDSSDR